MGAALNQPFRVLVVEDEPTVRRMYEAVLQRDGFDVTLASDGGEALQLFCDTSFDLLVVDYLLPKLDGVMLLTKTANVRVVPTIFASAVMRDEVTMENLRQLGVLWFLEKPFRLNVLREVLAEAKAHLAEMG